MSYYHSTMLGKKPLTSIAPKGEYEAVPLNGCPEPIGGDPKAGFPISKILETSFSKTIEGAILGGGRFCEEGRECILDIYETEEEPDVDISGCPYDFGVLDEVRYRREIPVRKKMRVTLSSGFIGEFEYAYPEEGSALNEEWLMFMKEFIAEQLRAGKTRILPIPRRRKEKELEEVLESYGMSKKEWEEHQRRAKKFAVEQSVPL